jgi:phosphatidylserine/phosphatidylglycerophosphate/cardiolipin synthase-like enzyme
MEGMFLKRKVRNFLLLTLLGVSIVAALYGVFRPLGEGLSIEGNQYHNSKVQFIYDLTYEQDGMIVHQQNIFAEVLELIEDAEEFIVLDMFLFNDLRKQDAEFPTLVANLTEQLLAKKQQNPDLEIYVLSDEINTFYGSYMPENFRQLAENGVEVIITDLNSLRDSNPLYSGIWRAFIHWWGTEGKGWLPNAFSAEGPKVTARSYLKMFNFKANHRKVVVTEKKALISSANPHDASGFHSNIAFVVEGQIIQDILESEKAVAALSDQVIAVDYEAKEDEQVAEMYALLQEPAVAAKTNTTNAVVETCLLTESKIKKHLLSEIKALTQGGQIWIGMFYLSDRQVIKELLLAAERGVDIRLVLDANKDAFGLEKNGIPNRPVANELYEKSAGKIKVRWYKTHGEQYHTKLVFLKGRGRSVIIGGSANLTRRNLDDYNLETDLKISAVNDSQLVQEIENYFNKIWTNEDGIYTLDFEEYRETQLWKKILYLFQEWTGFSTV